MCGCGVGEHVAQGGVVEGGGGSGGCVGGLVRRSGLANQAALFGTAGLFLALQLFYFVQSERPIFYYFPLGSSPGIF